MFRKLLTVTLILGLVIAFLVEDATGTDLKWREKQQALFDEIGMKPGDIIEVADWKRIDGLLPFSMVEWLKKGYLPNVRIAEFKYDISTDDEWINAGKKIGLWTKCIPSAI